ncbi:MAG: kelch repeat-containing protein [Deltaproteobacteria bacterium]|nr:kelch repeat-containing protein [Deltaproteobacteria bacterium]
MKKLGRETKWITLSLLALAACEDESSRRPGGDAAVSSDGSQDAPSSDGAVADSALADGAFAGEVGPSAMGKIMSLGARDVSRQAHAVVELADRQVLVIGGIKFPSPLSGLTDTTLYDVTAGSFSVVGRMQDGRHSHSATLLANGRVLVAGGYGGMPAATWRTAELYDPTTKAFTRVANEMSIPRLGHGAFTLSMGALAGKVLIMGGGALGTPLTVEVFDPATSMFSPVTTVDAPMERQGAAFAQLTDDSVLITGGRTMANAAAVLDSYVYVPSTATFRRVADALQSRRFPTATTLGDGRVLVVGGQSGSSGAGDELATTELYDPAMARFIAGPPMSSPRRNHTAARLGSGRVLIAGGNGPSSTLRTTEIFAPATNTFTSGSDLGQALSLIESVALSDGRVFLMGGQGMTGLVNRGAELFSE